MVTNDSKHTTVPRWRLPSAQSIIEKMTGTGQHRTENTIDASYIKTEKCQKLRKRLMTVRFELTPFRNSALSYRLRPLGQVIAVHSKLRLSS